MKQRSTKPLKRSRIKFKRKTRRVAMNSGKVREDAKGMAQLRHSAYLRSEGRCECYRVADEFRGEFGPCRRLPVSEEFGELHHSKPRSDVLERVSFLRKECHEIITGRLQWSRSAEL